MKAGIRFLSVIILSTLMGSLSAQPGQMGPRAPMTPEEVAKSTVEWMKTDLKIDDATQTKVHDVVLKYAKQSSEERQKLMTSGDHDAMRAKMTEIIAARDKELKPILGDKIFELFKTKENERRQAMMQQRQK